MALDFYADKDLKVYIGSIDYSELDLLHPALREFKHRTGQSIDPHCDQIFYADQLTQLLVIIESQNLAKISNEVHAFVVSLENAVKVSDAVYTFCD